MRKFLVSWEGKFEMERLGLNRGKLIKAVAYLLIAIVSFVVLGGIFSDASTYAGIVDSLDEKRNAVMALIASTAGAAALIGGIGGDIGAPIANELMDMSSSFGIILAAIYLEKYLLTLLGALAFKVLIPIASIAKLVSLFMGEDSAVRVSVSQIASKMALSAIALVLVVPCSVWVSEKVEETHEAYKTLSAESSQEDQATAIEEEAVQGQVIEKSVNDENSESEGLFASIKNSFGDLKDKAEDAAKDVVGGATEAIDSAISSAENFLSDILEKFAVMIVTSCLIPILVLVLFLWIVNTVLGTNFGLPRKGKVKPFKTNDGGDRANAVE